MTISSLGFVVDVLARGVMLSLDIDGRVKVTDRNRILTPGNLRLLRSLKPMLRDMLLTEVPERCEAAETACEGFAADVGVALCRRCGYGLGEHFWRRDYCTFHVGSDRDMCRRCGLAEVKHLPNRHR